MTVTLAQFQQNFPELKAATALQFGTYYDLAGLLLNPKYWPSDVSATTGFSALDYGAMLFVAHNLALELAETKTANAGGIPGQATPGVLSSKSVGSVSASYDTNAGIELNAGHWNLTSYGRRFIRLVRTVCAGAVQVGIGAPPNDGLNGGAWPGPYPEPLPGGSGFSS